MVNSALSFFIFATYGITLGYIAQEKDKQASRDSRMFDVTTVIVAMSVLEVFLSFCSLFSSNTDSAGALANDMVRQPVTYF